MSRNFKVSSRLGLEAMMSRLGLEAMMSRLGRFGPRSSSDSYASSTLKWKMCEQNASYCIYSIMVKDSELGTKK